MMKISVFAEGFHADTKLVEFVEKKLGRLDRLNNRILEAEVRLKLQDNGAKVQDKISEIRLLLTGGSIIDRKSAKTFEAAVDLSLDTLKRQLTRHKEKATQITRDEIA